jgi:hypothetical protein
MSFSVVYALALGRAAMVSYQRRRARRELGDAVEW